MEDLGSWRSTERAMTIEERGDEDVFSYTEADRRRRRGFPTLPHPLPFQVVPWIWPTCPEQTAR